MNLSKLFKKETKPATVRWQIQEGCTITEAFVIGGVQYYCIEDVFKTFTQRAFQAIAVYDEWNNRMTHDMLKAFINEMYNQLSGKTGQVDMNKIHELVQMIKERVEWVIPTNELLIKMAAVSFFDENESPYVYDEKYARKKIQFWKDNVEDWESFFFNVPLPLRSMFPLPNISLEDLKVCTEVIEKMSEKQLSDIIGMTSNGTLRNLLSHELKWAQSTTST